jgi:hypothetical protein
MYPLIDSCCEDVLFDPQSISVAISIKVPLLIACGVLGHSRT